MKALTLWQPWASLLACGAKKYETRSWATSYRGKIAIHAAKKDPCRLPLLGSEEFEKEVRKVMDEKLIEGWCLLPLGCIIATAELVGCYKITSTSENEYGNGSIIFCEYSDGKSHGIIGYSVEETEILFGDFKPGRYAWEFKNMKMLDEQIPAKGKQRIWNWEGE